MRFCLRRLTNDSYLRVCTYTFAYAYDLVSNSTVQSRAITSTQVTNYVYGAANRLTSVNGQAYTWDDNGNLIDDGAKTCTYNQVNRMTAIEDDKTSITYHYNGDGARLEQIVNEAPTTYALDLAAPLVQVLVATDGNGDTRYVYGVTRIGEQQSGGWLYHLSDALGSMRQLADSSGTVQLARGYTPYGEPLWTNGTASSRYAFTGEDYDPAVGLVFLRARYMQPTLGVFFARDPWSGDARRPGTMNGYSYTEGNPVNLVDPAGLCPENEKALCDTLARNIQSRFGVIIEMEYMPDPLPSLPMRNLACEENLWVSGELTTMYFALEEMRLFLGDASFYTYISNHTAIRRVDKGRQGDDVSTTYGGWFTSDPERIYSEPTIEFPTAVFESKAGKFNSQAGIVSTALHELFHVYSFGHPATLQTDFAQAAGWANVKYAFDDATVRWYSGGWFDSETVAQYILAASDAGKREEMLSKLGYTIFLPGDPNVDVAEYSQAGIMEDFTVSSTEFAELWLKQNHLDFGFFQQYTNQFILNRTNALQWLEEHYGRTIKH